MYTAERRYAKRRIYVLLRSSVKLPLSDRRVACHGAPPLPGPLPPGPIRRRTRIPERSPGTRRPLSSAINLDRRSPATGAIRTRAMACIRSIIGRRRRPRRRRSRVHPAGKRKKGGRPTGNEGPAVGRTDGRSIEVRSMLRRTDVGCYLMANL